ncbi:MAG: hypothetical protein M1837_003980 [Sclerophora amabilis]|nr:MAG: hypothetical protein M1837_003980 [Sclerophora amabilis]
MPKSSVISTLHRQPKPLKELQLTTEPPISNLVSYSFQGNILICRPCGYSMGFDSFNRHLRNPHGLTSNQRKIFLAYYEQTPVCRQTHSIPPLPHGSPPVPHLTLFNGWQCLHCDYLTAGKQRHVHRHLNHMHRGQWAHKVLNFDHYRPVQLQCWHVNNRYGPNPYWIVHHNPSTPLLPITASTKLSTPAEESYQALQQYGEQRQKEQQQKFLYYHCPLPIGDRATYEPWMRRTQWSQHLQGRDLQAIAHTTYLPGSRTLTVEHQLESGQLDEAYLEEETLRVIGDAIDHLFTRAMKTLQHIPHAIQCAAASLSLKGYWARPLPILQTTATRHRYVQAWKRLVAYFYRVSLLDPIDCQAQHGFCLHSKERHILHEIVAEAQLNLPVFQDDLSEEQSSPMGFVDRDPARFASKRHPTQTNLLPSADYSSDSLSEEDEDSDLEHSPQKGTNLQLSAKATRAEQTRLVELIFYFSIRLISQRADHGDINTCSTLLHYLAVIGIQAEDARFYGPYAYTPKMSALIWDCQVLVLEWALPITPYRHLQWLGREDCANWTRQFEIIRQFTGLYGSPTPLGEMLSLRSYGRKLAKDEGGQRSLQWSANLQDCQLQGQIFSVAAFKTFVRKILQDLKGQLQDLIYGQLPYVDLHTIADDLTSTKVGSSFRDQAPNAHLQNAYQDLMRRAWCNTDPHRSLQHRDQWHARAILAYFERIGNFLQTLLVAMHICSGQPARGPEITGILHTNSIHRARNVFCVHGRIVWITQYHKARTTTNHSFHVARFLPPVLDQVLAVYLIYIQPFVQLLQHQLHIPIDQAQYLFVHPHNPHKTWSTLEITHRLRALCNSHQPGFTLTVSSYRHVVIGICKKHIRPLAQSFNIDSEVDGTDAVFSWQAAHRPRQNRLTYGLDGAFPTQLQPELLDRYRWASGLWQEWLEIDQVTLSDLTPISKKSTTGRLKKQEEPESSTEYESEEDRDDHCQPKQLRSQMWKPIAHLNDSDAESEAKSDISNWSGNSSEPGFQASSITLTPPSSQPIFSSPAQKRPWSPVSIDSSDDSDLEPIQTASNKRRRHLSPSPGTFLGVYVPVRA